MAMVSFEWALCVCVPVLWPSSPVSVPTDNDAKVGSSIGQKSGLGELLGNASAAMRLARMKSEHLDDKEACMLNVLCHPSSPL